MPAGFWQELPPLWRVLGNAIVGVSIHARKQEVEEMRKLRRVLAVMLIAAAVLGLHAVPAEAATQISVSFSVNTTTSGPAAYDMHVFVLLPMDRVDAEGYVWNGARIEIRGYGDDPGTDPVIYGPYYFLYYNGLMATDYGVVLDLYWQEWPGAWMNEDDGYWNREDEFYIKATWVDADGGTLQATSGVITGLF
jgi:hypothetical protein